MEDSVVVITGASSGIGRATARAFAEKGAMLVLAARRETALQEVASECEVRGARTLVVPTDMADEAAVQTLARAAADTFGRIDTWVNNAAVSLFARFEEAPPEVYRKVFDTNFFGYVHGARAVLPIFREQGAGVLVNVSSVVATAPQPYTSAYVASKAAIEGFSECLRMELRLDDSDIRVCDVMPASIDTPIFQQSANYTGRAIKALDPAYPPEDVAEAIVKLAHRPRAETMVGNAGRMMAAEHSVAPRFYERMGARRVERNHFQDRSAEPTEGNLFVPMPEFATVRGGWSAPENGGNTGSLALAGAAIALPLLFWAWKSESLPLQK
ncbi:MAG: SDR family oxidoreductase [Gemmatimonadota bacterium]